jgi:hypothetical protein
MINLIISQNNHKKTLKSSHFLRSFLDLVHLEQKLQLLLEKDEIYEKFTAYSAVFVDGQFRFSI